MGLLIPIHKKGSRFDCENYGGICLLNVSYKILAVILFDRLEVYAEEIIGDYRGGFRIGRSTTDKSSSSDKSWKRLGSTILASTNCLWTSNKRMIPSHGRFCSRLWKNSVSQENLSVSSKRHSPRRNVKS